MISVYCYLPSFFSHFFFKLVSFVHASIQMLLHGYHLSLQPAAAPAAAPASHEAGIISCPSCSLKVIIFYAALCICQQRVFQVFFDIYLYLLFIIVHMTASCLLPAYATCRNAQLMDSLLSYLSFKRHIVFSETVITVSYCHSTFVLVLTST